MDRHLELAEKARYRFCGPVGIRLADEDGTRSWVFGESTDVSVYGLGLVFPVSIQVDTQVTVSLCGVELIGRSKVRHSEPCLSGFKIGLQFEHELFMQNVPGLDPILSRSFYNASKSTDQGSFIQRVRLWLLRILINKTG